MLALVVWAALIISACGGSRILVVFPVPERTSGDLGDALVRTLLEDQHEVTYVSVFPKKSSNANLTYVDISSVLQHQNGVSTRSTNDILRAGPRIAQDALQHEAVRQLLVDPSASFDAVVAHWYHSGLLAPLAELFECPLIWYTSGDVSWRTLKLVHEDPSAAYSADPLGSSTAPPYAAKDRLYQLSMQVYLNLWTYYNTHFVEIPAYDAIYRTPLQLRKRFLPPYDQLVHNASLLMVNSHPPLGQALPMPLNAKHVGGHHIPERVKPLPKTLQTFLDNAEHGVIFISLGAGLDAKMSNKQQQQLLDVLANLEQLVLWQMDQGPEYLPRNVRVLQKAPRMSILSHPKVKVFITDGSLSSLIEATSSGVPVVAVPAAADQGLSADLVVARGLGLKVDLNQYLPWYLEGAIKQILGNYSFKLNAEQASVVFHRRVTPVNSELLHWLQLVMSTRGAPHLRSPALQVPTLERLYADLWVLAVLGIWFLSKVLKVVQVHLKDLDKKNQ